MVAQSRWWHAHSMQSIDYSLLAPPDRAFYLESSLPPGLTVDQYRRGRPRRSTRWKRLKRLAGRGPAPAAA
jgi:hypothetical protein